MKHRVDGDVIFFLVRGNKQFPVDWEDYERVVGDGYVWRVHRGEVVSNSGARLRDIMFPGMFPADGDATNLRSANWSAEKPAPTVAAPEEPKRRGRPKSSEPKPAREPMRRGPKPKAKPKKDPLGRHGHYRRRHLLMDRLDELVVRLTGRPDLIPCRQILDCPTPDIRDGIQFLEERLKNEKV